MGRIAIVAIIIVTAWTAPRDANACSDKHNQLAIVLGMVGSGIVTLHIDLRESGDLVASQWSGTATLSIDGQTVTIGAIDPARDPSKELERLVAAARAQAALRKDFQPAREDARVDCSERMHGLCTRIHIEAHAGELTIDRNHFPLPATVDREVLDSARVTGVVRYRIGQATMLAINIGIGSAKFASALRMCTAPTCSTITTLHHGEQLDIVVRLP